MNQNIILRRMRRSPFFVVGFVLALSILLICFVSPLFVAYDAEKSSISERLLSPVGFVDGWSGHILGTDQLGRDVLTRLLTGGGSFSAGAGGIGAGNCGRVYRRCGG